MSTRIARGSATAALGALCVSATACFTGTFAAGHPCQRDADCGPQLACIDGYCGGQRPDPGTTTEGGMSTSTGDATTSGSGSQTGTTASATTGSPYLCEQLDVLLILDNSSSMNEWDPKLFQLGLFFESIVAEGLSTVASWHFGVITTDQYEDNPASCQEYGALAFNSQNITCGPWEDRPYLTEEDGFNLDNLPCFIVLEGGSSNERPMEGLLNATSPAFNAPGGCNAGFMREDALLVVLLLTDEDDDHASSDPQGNAGSPGDPQFWYEKLLYHKAGNADSLVFGALLGDDPNATDCPFSLPMDGDEKFGDGKEGAEEGVRIRQFMDQLPVGHAFTSSVCADSYNDFFEQFFNEIVADACEDFDPLATDPMIEDPTEGDPSDTGTTETDTDTDTDTDTGGALEEPEVGKGCDPGAEHGTTPFCWTSGYGEIGTVYRCGNNGTWQEVTVDACENACGDNENIGGCSGNGQDQSEWACLCSSGGCEGGGCKDGQLYVCDGDLGYLAECDSCLNDPMAPEKAICGPNPDPVLP